MPTRGNLFVISGPSGAGKGTIVKELLLRDKADLWVSISATTRKPRVSEKEGLSYFFIDRSEFERLIDEDGFLEWALVHGEYYGTPRSKVEEKLASGTNVILEIDPQGALQVKALVKNAILIFIKTKTIEDLRARLKARNTEAEAEIDTRCKNAEGELELADKYDFVVLNDDVSVATDEVMAIINGHIDMKNSE